MRARLLVFMALLISTISLILVVHHWLDRPVPTEPVTPESPVASPSANSTPIHLEDRAVSSVSEMELVFQQPLSRELEDLIRSDLREVLNRVSPGDWSTSPTKGLRPFRTRRDSYESILVAVEGLLRIAEPSAHALPETADSLNALVRLDPPQLLVPPEMVDLYRRNASIPRQWKGALAALSRLEDLSSLEVGLLRPQGVVFFHGTARDHARSQLRSFGGTTLMSPSLLEFQIHEEPPNRVLLCFPCGRLPESPHSSRLPFCLAYDRGAWSVVVPG